MSKVDSVSPSSDGTLRHVAEGYAHLFLSKFRRKIEEPVAISVVGELNRIDLVLSPASAAAASAHTGWLMLSDTEARIVEKLDAEKAKNPTRPVFAKNIASMLGKSESAIRAYLHNLVDRQVLSRDDVAGYVVNRDESSSRAG